MVADFVLRSVETISARDKFTSTFEKIDHRIHAHSSLRAGMELCIHTKALNDGLGKRFTAEIGIQLQHQIHYFVSVYFHQFGLRWEFTY